MLENISWAEYAAFIIVTLICYYLWWTYKYRHSLHQSISSPSDKRLYTAADRSSALPTPSVRKNESYDRSAILPAASANPRVQLKDEIEALFQNLSFFNSGNKSYVIGALQEILSKQEYRSWVGQDDPDLFSFIISKAKSYCSVKINTQEINDMVQSVTRIRS